MADPALERAVDEHARSAAARAVSVARPEPELDAGVGGALERERRAARSDRCPTGTNAPMRNQTPMTIATHGQYS